MTQVHDHGVSRIARMGVAEPGWRSRSACRGLPSDLFVSGEMMRPEEEAAAKRVCGGCPVVDDCLTYAIVNNIRFGVWGGLTGEERRPLRRRWLESRHSLLGRVIETAMS